MCKTLVLLVFSRTGSIGKLGQPRIACAEALTAVEPARDGRLLRKSCDLAALAQNRDRRLSGFPYIRRRKYPMHRCPHRRRFRRDAITPRLDRANTALDSECQQNPQHTVRALARVH